MSKALAHLGNPCIFCGTPHDEVAIGDCPERVGTAMYWEGIKALERRAALGSSNILPLEAKAILQELKALRYGVEIETLKEDRGENDSL